MRSYFFFPIVFALIAASCSKINSEDISQKEIYTDYNISYDVKSNQVIARATFISSKSFSSMTRIKLSGDSFVSLNGKELKLDGIIDKNISLEYSARLTLEDGKKEATLIYQNNDGEIFENTFTVLGEPIFKVAPKIVEVNNLNHLEIDKESLPVENGELYLILKDDKLKTLESGILLSSEIGPAGEASFPLKPDLSKSERMTENGEVGLCIKVKRSNIEKPEAGGLLSLTTYGHPISVRILD